MVNTDDIPIVADLSCDDSARIIDKDHIYCPVARRIIPSIDCMEITDVANRIMKPGVLLTFTPPIEWDENQRNRCLQCPYPSAGESTVQLC